ncbi:MAG TPA: S9 family peptidase [Geminicoccaceae bacterium]|nr:S9 family peptidase [Geminicoccaceae bacterium]
MMQRPEAKTIGPPRPRRQPVLHERFGCRWIDEYAWLRDPGWPIVSDPEVLAHLEAENAWYQAVMAPHAELIERIHAELSGRIQEDERSVPVREGGYEYEWRYPPGEQYRVWLRRAPGEAAPGVILDENRLAAGRGYFSLRSLVPSPDGRLLAYATDEDGSERYALHLKDLESGVVLADLVTNTDGSVVWSTDSGTLFYVELGPSLRPCRVRAHRLGSAASTDRTVFEEADPAFFVSVGKTLSGRFVTIATGTHVTREAWLIEAADPAAPPRLVTARRHGHRYRIEHRGERLYILTNDRHPNFRLVSAPIASAGETRWTEEIAPDPRCYLLALACFEEFLVLMDRCDGREGVRILDYAGREHRVELPEVVCTVALGDNREPAADRVRLVYSSMVSPARVLDYVVPTRRLRTRKVQRIPSGYDPSAYVTTRLAARAPDGAAVPITVLHRRDYPLDGSGRLYLYGYGSYGSGLDFAFNPTRFSLVDRGFCFALAHVRGGDELGPAWWRAGQLEQKPNTFKDFIACAEHLIAMGYASAGNIAIKGVSAGGMLIGAALNLRPELWRCAVAEVPFVDVLNTMLDADLLLTPVEWPEWGNPFEDAAAFEIIRSYAPYENLRLMAYPHLLVTAAVSDPRVPYWEPAKYVARLRATKTDDNLLLLRTHLDAGHFGRSGRYQPLRDLAEQFVFYFHCFGMIARSEV